MKRGNKLSKSASSDSRFHTQTFHDLPKQHHCETMCSNTEFMAVISHSNHQIPLTFPPNHSYNIMQNALSPGFKVSIIAVLICLPLFLPLSSLQSQSHMDNTDKLDCHLGMDLHFFELHLEMLFGFAF